MSKKIPFPIKTVALSCLHTVTYKAAAPAKGDTVFCVRCDDYQTVTCTTSKRVAKS